nr:NAD-dependent epimerase/dehydratase family protein [Candidatus Arsenophonus nilaparvatae]
MKILIIGATGYIGSAIVEKLKTQPVELYGLVRSTSAAEKIKKMAITPVCGDILKLDSLKPMVKKLMRLSIARCQVYLVMKHRCLNMII